MPRNHDQETVHSGERYTKPYTKADAQGCSRFVPHEGFKAFFWLGIFIFGGRTVHPIRNKYESCKLADYSNSIPID